MRNLCVALGSRDERSERRPALARRPMCNHVVAMPTVQREITVPADPDEVWEALTDEAIRDTWLQDGDAPREITDEQADEEAGRYAFRWARPGESATEVSFVV